MKTLKAVVLVAVLLSLLVSCEEVIHELTLSGGSVAVSMQSLAAAQTPGGDQVNLVRITLTDPDGEHDEIIKDIVPEEGERKVKGYIFGVPYDTWTATVELFYVDGDSQTLIAFATAEVTVEPGVKAELKINFENEQAIEYEVEWPTSDPAQGPPEQIPPN